MCVCVRACVCVCVCTQGLWTALYGGHGMEVLQFRLTRRVMPSASGRAVQGLGLRRVSETLMQTVHVCSCVYVCVCVLLCALLYVLSR